MPCPAAMPSALWRPCSDRPARPLNGWRGCIRSHIGPAGNAPASRSETFVTYAFLTPGHSPGSWVCGIRCAATSGVKDVGDWQAGGDPCVACEVVWAWASRPWCSPRAAAAGVAAAATPGWRGRRPRPTPLDSRDRPPSVPTTRRSRRSRSSGYTAWLNEQFAKPQTLHRTYMDQVTATLPTGSQRQPEPLLRIFWKQAVTGEDQLRQRVAFALSQIFVVSLRRRQREQLPARRGVLLRHARRATPSATSATCSRT